MRKNVLKFIYLWMEFVNFPFLYSHPHSLRYDPHSLRIMIPIAYAL